MSTLPFLGSVRVRTPAQTPLGSDTFQRANESPLAAPWAIDTFGDSGLQVVSNVCVATGSLGANFQIYKQPGGTPNDQYVSVTIAAVGGAFQRVRLFVRMTDNGLTMNSSPTNPAYHLSIVGSGNWFLTDWAGSILLASGTGLTLSPGDVFTLAAVGTTLSAYQNGVLLASVTNSTYASGSTALNVDGGGSPFQISKFEMGSAVALQNCFLGTVKVIGSAPAGRSNPYLGSVAVLSQAPAGPPNVSEGQVVVVTNPPAGVAGDPFLGSVLES